MDKMIKNRYKTDSWKSDTLESVDLYNEWFMTYAPAAYKDARKGVVSRVKKVFKLTSNLKEILSETIFDNPSCITVLRACTAPPLAIDRLTGLSNINKNLLKKLEEGKIPSRMSKVDILNNIEKMLKVIVNLLDTEVLTWLMDGIIPSSQSVNRSCAIISDRITGALADPIIRNSQEKRQLDAIDSYLFEKGYTKIDSKSFKSIDSMPPKTFIHHMNVPVKQNIETNMPIDVVIQPPYSGNSHFPLLVECKSAGDFLNTNKRRKEEAAKMQQLVHTYGKDNITFILFLCGYFDTGYLGYEASECIDWVWEHRISDFSQFGI